MTTTQASSKSAADIQADRMADDRLSHEARILWLAADSPKWACGTPVSKSDAAEMLRKSRSWLANPYA